MPISEETKKSIVEAHIKTSGREYRTPAESLKESSLMITGCKNLRKYGVKVKESISDKIVIEFNKEDYVINRDNLSLLEHCILYNYLNKHKQWLKLEECISLGMPLKRLSYSSYLNLLNGESDSDFCDLMNDIMEIHLSGFADIALTKKRNRISAYAEIYDEALTERFSGETGKGTPVYKKDLTNAIKALDMISIECGDKVIEEGNKNNISIHIENLKTNEDKLELLERLTEVGSS